MIYGTKVFKSRPSKLCGRQPLKTLNISSNFLKAIFHKIYLFSTIEYFVFNIHDGLRCHILSLLQMVSIFSNRFTMSPSTSFSCLWVSRVLKSKELWSYPHRKGVGQICLLRNFGLTRYI